VKKSRKWKAESLKKKRLIHGFGAAGRDALPKEDGRLEETRYKRRSRLRFAFSKLGTECSKDRLEQNVPVTSRGG
jgi:hypothetical protein